MKLNFKFIILVIVLLFSTLLAACSSQEKTQPTKDEIETSEVNGNVVEDEDAKEVLQVFTTIFPLTDFTKKIGGEYVEVKSLIPVGADAHTFEPSAKTMVDVAKADLYVYNGAGIEGFADAAADVLKTSNVKILKALEGIELIEFAHEHSHEDEHDDHDKADEKDHGHSHEDAKQDQSGSEQDPHAWLDPIRAIQLAENIKNALVELMPEAATQFESNFALLKQELQALDQKFIQMVAEVPKDTIIVSHAGYGYWTDRYGIKQIGIAGISPMNEPSIRQIQEVIEYAEHYNINYIMFEQNIPTAIAETVLSQIGAVKVSLHNLESLVAADLKSNEDYISLMEKNIEALRTALQ